jgi:signal transduction histidine kinase
MYEDTTSKGILWLGTNGGLFAVNIHTGTVRHWTEAKGLPNNVVYGILPDDAGNLWLSTNRGLAKFNPTSQTFRAYTLSDGLPSNEFNQGAYFRANSGELFFGSMEGLVSFFPHRVRDNPFVPPIVLTAFKKFNKPVTLDTAITLAHTIEIPHSDNFISFEFAALNFLNSQKNKYMYKLEGFDNDWIYAGEQRTVNYTNLDPGTYQFRVKGSNNDGVWNDVGATLQLRVLPPWWQRWWFRSGLLVMVVGGLGAGYYGRMRFVKAQNHKLKGLVASRTVELEAMLVEVETTSKEIQRQHEILEEQAREIEFVNSELQMTNQTLEDKNGELALLNNEKNEFLGIASHDLKNPLASIILTIDKIQRYASRMTAEQITQSQNSIRQTAQRMVTIITNLLDVNALESGKINIVIEPVDVSAIVQTIVHDYQEKAALKNILLYAEGTETQHYALADGNIVQEVLDNLVSNAVKYSPHGKRVWVSVVSDESNLTERLSSSEALASGLITDAYACLLLTVRDEGQGLTEEDKGRLFGKFARLSAQPTGGEHSTGLGLSIVKKLVEAMHGRVWCESELGKGATFVVELPSV